MVPTPLQSCANDGCGEQFTPSYSEQKFCSRRCATVSHWKNRGRHALPKHEIIKRVFHEGENEADVAASYRTSISSIQRIMQEAGLRGKRGLEKKKQIYIERDKTVFVVAADPVRAADVEYVIRQVLRDQQMLAGKYVMRVYEPFFTMKAAAAAVHRVMVGSAVMRPAWFC